MESVDEMMVGDLDATVTEDPVALSAPVLTPSYPSILQSFGILLIFICCSIAAVPLLLVMGALHAELAMLLYYLAAAGATFAIVHAIRARKLGSSTYCFRIDSWKLVVPLALTSAALLFGVIGPIVSLIPVPDVAGQEFEKMLAQFGPATFLYFVVAAPVLEELIFRGIMLDGLLKRYRPITAILVSSFIFGLAHLNPWQFVTAFVLGCFMGWVYLRSRSVGPCILIHMTANFCGYLVRVVYTLSGITDQGEVAWSSAVVLPIICLTVILVSVLYLRREFDHLAMVRTEVEAPFV